MGLDTIAVSVINAVRKMSKLPHGGIAQDTGKRTTVKSVASKACTKSKLQCTTLMAI